MAQEALRRGIGQAFLQVDAGNDAARNMDNCKSAPVKLRSFLANRHTDIYSAVGSGRYASLA